MVPSPRSEKELNPCMPLEVLLVPVVTPVEPCSEGSSAIVLKMLGSAFLAISAAPNTWVGVGARKPVEVILVPVTTTSCTVPVCARSDDAVGAVSCAGAAVSAACVVSGRPPAVLTGAG